MTPAALIVWYYEIREGLGAPGLNFIDSTGRVYVKECEACGFSFRNSNKVNIWVCGKCGKPWGYEDHFILKGEVQTSNPPDVFERQNARWVDVGVILHRLLGDAGTKWNTRLYIATCHGYKVEPYRGKETGDLRLLGDIFQETFPDAPGPWGVASLYRRVAGAKKAFERELQKAGINFS